ncbi:hypothetical protein [Anabaena sp. UHCC 0451]|uniref:hypothetical protein n=1 Tax=Anabaena sp. UHCC 0451 TaxID=2055235 RepID=UPI002B1EC5A3|nr:hypothetical protein [Anabaena sp. UHCC 0451]MEA5578436.1 hypothetical protein [Anabaena sp. UHCC 0451]
MLRSNTKKPLTYYPQKPLTYYPQKPLTYYPQKQFSYYPQKQFSYYHLIASFVIGLVGGYAINNFYQNHHYQSLVDSPSLAQAKTATAVKLAAPTIKIDKQKAFNSVWNLPQVQRKAKEIENLSQGDIRVAAVVESLPTAKAPFYIVRVFENHPDKTTSPVYWLRVSSSSGIIEPLDLVQNKYIALEKWNPDGR